MSVAPYGGGYAGGLAIPTLHTEELTLCGLAEEHLDDYTRIQYDHRVAEWMGGLPDPPPSQQEQREDTWRVIATFLGHWALRGYGQWALVRTSDGRFVGRAGLWNPEGWPGVEVGWLVDPELWGRGYASQAGRAAVDFAFDRLHLDEIVSVTLPHNTRSRRVMDKVGLSDTGTTVELRGHTQVLYRLSRDEWAASATRGGGGADA